MTKRVSSTEYALYNFLSEEYFRIPHFKEIHHCRVKKTTNVLELLNLDEKISRIVQNYLVFRNQHVVPLCALLLRVCLSVNLPQRLYCTVFSWKNMCEYHIVRIYRVAE